MKIERKCVVCGKVFWVYASALKYRKSILCSKKCRSKWDSRLHPGIKKKCLVCGKEFKAFPSAIKLGFRKFCSRKCGGVFYSKNYAGQNGSNWKGGDVKYICKTCGKEFKANRSAGCKFCSSQCYGKWLSKTRRGAAVPSWRGGITSVVRRIRNSPPYKQWRKACFQRDRFTCQVCGDTTKSHLEIHHKKEQYRLLLEIKKEIPLLSVFDGAMLFAPLWSISNGITLCKKCHIKQGRVTS